MADCHRRARKRGMAPPFSSRFSPKRKSKDHGGLSCENARTCARAIQSHDWHVQPSCQRPNRTPPERRASVQADSENRRERQSLLRIRLSSKPYQVTVLPLRCQPIGPTGFPPVFHNGTLLLSSAQQNATSGPAPTPFRHKTVQAQAGRKSFI